MAELYIISHAFLGRECWIWWIMMNERQFTSSFIPIKAQHSASIVAEKEKKIREKFIFFIRILFSFFSLSHQNDSSALIIHPKVLILLLLFLGGLFGSYTELHIYVLPSFHPLSARETVVLDLNISQPLSLLRHHRPAIWWDNRSNYTQHTLFFLFILFPSSVLGIIRNSRSTIWSIYTSSNKPSQHECVYRPSACHPIRDPYRQLNAYRTSLLPCVRFEGIKESKQSTQQQTVADTFHYSIEWSPWPLAAYIFSDCCAHPNHSAQSIDRNMCVFQLIRFSFSCSILFPCY